MTGALSGAHLGIGAIPGLWRTWKDSTMSSRWPIDCTNDDFTLRKDPPVRPLSPKLNHRTLRRGGCRPLPPRSLGHDPALGFQRPAS